MLADTLARKYLHVVGPATGDRHMAARIMLARVRNPNLRLAEADIAARGAAVPRSGCGGRAASQPRRACRDQQVSFRRPGFPYTSAGRRRTSLLALGFRIGVFKRQGWAPMALSPGWRPCVCGEHRQSLVLDVRNAT